MSNSGLDYSASTKAGLARIRKLTSKNGNSTMNPSSNILDLPNGDYFNEQKSKQIWEEIERKDDSKTNDIQKETLKRTEAVSDLQDTSGKIRSLVSKFDDIDQETLMSLLAIYDESGNGTVNEQLDTGLIMSDSKAQVIDLIGKLNDLSSSEHGMIETLKFWFDSLQKRSDDSGIELGDIPSVSDVVEGLEKVVQEFTEKSEKAVCFHNDITDFMFKQFSQFKRALLAKDEQIKKLQKTIDDNNAAAERRRQKKKQEEKPPDDGIKKEQFDAQIRQNLELKKQIQELKQSLQTSEVQRLALSAIGQNDPTHSRELLEANADVANLKLENEALSNMYLKRIEDLNNKVDELTKKLDDSENRGNALSEKIKKRDDEIARLEGELQRQIQLTSIAQAALSKQNEKQDDFDDTSNNTYDEKHLLMLKHEEEIRELQNQFRQDLKSQLDYQKQAFNREKQALINSIGQPEAKGLLAAIQENCDRQIEELKKENEKIKENALKEISRKLALLTRQYEHRIKSINQAHQVEMNTAKNSLDYEKKKYQIDADEKFNIDLIKAQKKREAKLEEARKTIEKLKKKNEKLTKENETVKRALSDLSESAGVNKDAFIGIKEEDEETNSVGSASQITDEDEAEEKMAITSNEKFTIKNKILKEEMENQMNWALEKQRIYYEREMERKAEEQQREIREQLLSLQEKIASSEKLEDAEEVSNAVNNISTVFAKMNDQLGSYEQIDEPTIPLSELNNRTKELTDKIISIRQKYEDLKMSRGPDGTEELRRQLERNTKLSSGDQEKLYEQINYIQAKHNEELDQRDKIINELAKIGSNPPAIVHVKAPKLTLSQNIELYTRETVITVSNAEQATEQFASMATTPIASVPTVSVVTTPIMATPARTRPESPVRTKYNFDAVEILHVESSISLLPTKILKSYSTNQLVLTSPEQISIPGRSDQISAVQTTPNIDLMKVIDELQGSSQQNEQKLSPSKLVDQKNTEQQPRRRFTIEFPNQGTYATISSKSSTEPKSIIQSPLVGKHSLDNNSTYTYFPSLQSLTINGDKVDYIEKLNPIAIDPETGRLQDPEPIELQEARKNINLSVYYESRRSIDIPEVEFEYEEEEEVAKNEQPATPEKEEPTTIDTTPVVERELVIKKEEKPKPKIKKVVKKYYAEASVQVSTIVEKKEDKIVVHEIDKDDAPKLAVSISSPQLELPQQQINKELTVSSPLLQNIEAQDSKIEMTPIANSFHVSEFPSPRKPTLSMVVTFSGEKLPEKHEYQYTNNGEMFNNEPEIVVYLSQCEGNMFEIPLIEHKLEQIVTNTLERLEPKIEVVSKDPENMGVNFKLVTISAFTVKENRNYIKRHVSEPLVIEVLIDENKQKLFNMFNEIKNLALEHNEKTLNRYSKEIASQKEELKKRPDVVLVKEPSFDELKPPQFSNQRKKEPIDMKKMGIPKVTKDNIIPNHSTFVVDNVEDKVPEQIITSASSIKISTSEAEIAEDAGKLEETVSDDKPKKQEQNAVQPISIPGVDIMQDPFGSSFKIASVQLRHIKEFIEQDEEIGEKIGGDTSAYFAYISATGVTDEAHYSFINSLKASKSEHDDLHSQLFYIQSLTMFLTKCLRQMKIKYTNLEEEFNKQKAAQASEEVQLQQELLHSIQNRPVDANASLGMQQLDTLHQLQNSLSMLTDLGLVKNQEKQEELEVLDAKVKGAIAKIGSEKELKQDDVDQLVAEVQQFIATLSNPTNLSPRVTDLESSKADRERLRKERNQLRKNLKNEKLKTESLEIQVESLKQRLAEAKESSRADSTLTQAQLENLKNAIKATDEGNTGDSKEIFKKQMLNMAALLDASNAEKNMLRNKVDDLEDEIAHFNEREKRSQAQIRELVDNNMDMQRNNSSATMFKDADIEHLKEQLAADQDIAAKQRTQLEEAAATNTQLLAANSTLEEELFKANSEIRQLQMQLDEISYTAAMKSVNPQQPPTPQEKPKKIQKADKGIQKNFDFSSVGQPKRKKQETKKANMDDKQLMDSMLLNSIEKISKDTKPQRQEEPKEMIDEKKEVSSVIPEITKEEEEKAEEEENLPLSTFASKENLFISKDSLRDSMPSEDDVFGEDFVQTQTQQRANLDDIMPHLVHDPLKIPKKPKIKLPLTNTPAKTNKSMRRHMNTTSVIPSLPRNDEVDLHLGNAVQGKRQVTGTSRQIKPTTNISDATAAVIAATSRNKPEGGIPIITSSFSLQQLPGLPNTSSSLSVPLYDPSVNAPAVEQRPFQQLIDKTLELAPPAPVRITLVMPRNENESEEKRQKGPIIAKQPPLAQTSEHPTVLALKGAQIQKKKESREVQEALRLSEKLRSQVKRLSAQNETNERTIMQLRQKISELTLQLHRSKLDVIKANDERKRTQIRADNVKSRLDICYNEISARDDEIIKLRREIILLKNATAPITEVSTKIMQARRERERIKREREQKAQMKDATEQALRSATNEATAKHLEILLANTQNSIARLESKRRMWKEIERKQAMAVLGAMSLLSTSEVKTVKSVLPEYSPFRSNRLNSLKEILKEQRDNRYSLINAGSTEKFQDYNQQKEPEPTYSEKVAILDKIQPPLTDEERRDVVLRKESPELNTRILTAIKKERDSSAMTNNGVTPTATI